jgi:hypothetical protein
VVVVGGALATGLDFDPLAHDRRPVVGQAEVAIGVFGEDLEVATSRHLRHDAILGDVPWVSSSFDRK